jgi:hypothetical protein
MLIWFGAQRCEIPPYTAKHARCDRNRSFESGHYSGAANSAHAGKPDADAGSDPESESNTKWQPNAESEPDTQRQSDAKPESKSQRQPES